MGTNVLTAQLTLKNNHINLPKLMGDTQQLNSWGWNSREFQTGTHVIAGSCDVGGYLAPNTSYWHSGVKDKDILGTTNMCGLMVLDKLVAYINQYSPETVWFSCARLLPNQIVEIDNSQVCLYNNSQRLIRFLQAKRLITRDQREQFLHESVAIDQCNAINDFVKQLDWVAQQTKLVWMPTATPEAQHYWDRWLDAILDSSTQSVKNSYCGRVTPIDENPDNTIGPKTRILIYEAFRHFKFKL